jgi:hypothetical protein
MHQTKGFGGAAPKVLKDKKKFNPAYSAMAEDKENL